MTLAKVAISTDACCCGLVSVLCESAIVSCSRPIILLRIGPFVSPGTPYAFPQSPDYRPPELHVHAGPARPYTPQRVRSRIDSTPMSVLRLRIEGLEICASRLLSRLHAGRLKVATGTLPISVLPTPPSTVKSCALIYDERSLARKLMTLPISCGMPIRAAGMSRVRAAAISGSR